ncbi:MAG TPA: hypothetical protein VKS21_09805 [Spirochaetota bacterium]|nr:hypothetical protein [Spirochaetota bacterium]
MNKEKYRMIRKAVSRWKHIYPCSGLANFENCFTTMGNKLIFWFNTDDHSTHVLIKKAPVVHSKNIVN